METAVKAIPYEILKPYEGKWVAISRDRQRVVSSGNTLEEAANNIKKQEEVSYLKVVPSDISFAPDAFRFS